MIMLSNWNDQKNARRTELICKDHRLILTLEERKELRFLTQQMRQATPRVTEEDFNSLIKTSKALEKRIQKLSTENNMKKQYLVILILIAHFLFVVLAIWFTEWFANLGMTP